jgi:5-hydroxyisourate hydrolase-like protein (transthyretin family)
VLTRNHKTKTLKGKYFIILNFCLFLFLVSCAHELPLTGGDKDATPPVAEKFSPPNQSINFNAKKINIEFDEYVKLKDATKQILISPPGTEFEVVEKGKSIELTITSPLQVNTTYVINFGGSVIDHNEGNILTELVYTFSTGNVMDSLTTSFKVLDAFSLKPAANVKVMLYRGDNDSLPLTILPSYAGTTDINGKASIGYMQTGQYKVFVLQEENKNYVYDKSNEGIGFIEQPVIAGDSLPYKILYFKEEAINPKIQSAKMSIAGMVNFKFTGSVEKNQLQIISKNIDFDTSHFEFIGSKKDSAVYWFKPMVGNDTLRFQFNRKQGEKDSIRLYPKIINTNKNNVVTGAPAMKIINTIPADFDFYKKLEIEFAMPIDTIQLNQIIFKEEGTVIPFTLNPKNGTNRIFVLDYNFKQAKNYSIYFPKKSVRGILGASIDSTIISFKTSNEKAYKTLTLSIKNPEISGAAILQIINDKDLVLEEKIISQIDIQSVEFKNLRQGSYRIKLIYDANNNGIWDSGNYKEKKQPEKVVFFPQNIDIKPNFDYVLEWDIMPK